MKTVLELTTYHNRLKYMQQELKEIREELQLARTTHGLERDNPSLIDVTIEYIEKTIKEVLYNEWQNKRALDEARPGEKL